jgi:hypothetical protein
VQADLGHDASVQPPTPDALDAHRVPYLLWRTKTEIL